MKEEFRVFDNQFINYEVSNKGEVRKRVKYGYRYLTGHVQPKTGYLRICIMVNGQQKGFHIHSLVAKAFLGQRPEKYVIDHIDRNRLNNYVSNLRYVTYRENKQNSDTFKNYIYERTVKDGTIKYVVDIRRNENRYKKTFLTREEAEKWIENEDFSDARKTAKQGEGHVHTYTDVKGNAKYRAMIRINQKLYTKTFDHIDDCYIWINDIRSNDVLPVSTRRSQGSGNVSTRTLKNGTIRYDAKIRLNKKTFAKSFDSQAEANNWLVTMTNEVHDVSV